MPKPHVSRLDVFLSGRHVGTLAETPDGLAAFQYSEEWLRDGFSISPRSLPLSSRVFVAAWRPFDGIHGAFNDSLPDGWGRLVLDRTLAAQGIDPASIGALVRLSIAGTEGRGGLSYVPQTDIYVDSGPFDFDEMARLCNEVFEDREVDDLDAVYAAGGLSGGARPKAYISLDGEGWLVKFPSRIDVPEVGKLEFDYMACAAECGIEVPETRLLPSANHGGYFATKRFDRIGDQHVHMLTASALLEVSHRVPSLDYRSLFQLSYFLTGQHQEAEQLFRRMCFNVYAHNHDDHSNNFTWLCKEGKWRLSPAYDLTFSSTSFGGHTTTVCGSPNPGMDEVLALASEAGIAKSNAVHIASQIRDRCRGLLEDHGLADGALDGRRI